MTLIPKSEGHVEVRQKLGLWARMYEYEEIKALKVHKPRRIGNRAIPFSGMVVTKAVCKWQILMQQAVRQIAHPSKPGNRFAPSQY